MNHSPLDRHDELRAWVAEVVGQHAVTLKRRPGGGSHEAWDVVLDGTAHWFLRCDGSEPPADKHYTLRREAEIYRVVHGAGLPCPAVLGVHPDLSAVVLERSGGDAAFARLGSEAQTEIIDDFAVLLARLHAIDVATLELRSVRQATTIIEAVHHELDLWEAHLDASGACDPLLTACFRWLRDNVPDTGDAPPALVQGDTGPGNFLHDGHRVTALLDFELGHLGDPMEDIAWVGTRNAQEPVPDFERFLAHYHAAVGMAPDRSRIRYHAVFAEVRIATLGATRRRPPGASPSSAADLGAEYGNRLIYGALHRRLTVEALAAAMGVELPHVEPTALRDTDDTRYFDATLHQLQHRIGPEIADPWAARLLKGLARVTKYLREVDRAGGRHEQAELDDLARLLGERPATILDGEALLLSRVQSGETSAADLLPYAAGQVARRTQLVGPAMGRLATSHLPVV